MLKILVVDDEPRVRRGISSLIEEYSDKYELAGCCESAADAIEFFTRLQISKCPIWMDWN